MPRTLRFWKLQFITVPMGIVKRWTTLDVGTVSFRWIDTLYSKINQKYINCSINRKHTVPRSEREILLRYLIELMQLFYHTNFQVCVIISRNVNPKLSDFTISYGTCSNYFLNQLEISNIVLYEHEQIGFRKHCFPHAQIYSITVCLAHYPVLNLVPSVRYTVFLATRKSRML
jgi:hypothetical protein